MTHYEFAKPAKVGGDVYRSRTEAYWARLFQELRIGYDYEPTTFQLPDGDLYTPDFCLRGSRRFIEVKNQNTTFLDCARINTLARCLGSHTILLDGNPKQAHAFIFDGRPPKPDAEGASEPANSFAFRYVYGHNPGMIINAVLQPSPYEMQDLKLPRWPLKQIVGSLQSGIDFDVADSERLALHTKFVSRIPVQLAEPADALERYASAPERRV